MQCHLESTVGCGIEKDSGFEQDMHIIDVTNSTKIEIDHRLEAFDAHNVNVTMDHDSFKRRLRLYQQHDASSCWCSARSGMISSVKHHIENMEVRIFTLWSSPIPFAFKIPTIKS